MRWWLPLILALGCAEEGSGDTAGGYGGARVRLAEQECDADNIAEFELGPTAVILGLALCDREDCSHLTSVDEVESQGAVATWPCPFGQTARLAWVEAE